MRTYLNGFSAFRFGVEGAMLLGDHGALSGGLGAELGG